MLRKLIKYDLLADYKKYAAVYIAMLASSVLLLFFDKMTSWIKNNAFIDIMTMVFMFVFFTITIISGVMLLVFSTIRFYKNIVRDEGYLTHTLPVSTWQLIASKFISVYIWFFAMVIVTGICSGIAFGEPFWLFKLNDAFGEISEVLMSEDFAADDIKFVFLMLKYFAVFMLFSPFLAMSHIYFAFALGNLFNKSKLGMSVVMYFAVMFAEQIIGSVFAMFFYSDMMTLVTADPNSDFFTAQAADFFGKAMNFSLTAAIIFAIGYTIAAERIFAKKLNLE